MASSSQTDQPLPLYHATTAPNPLKMAQTSPSDLDSVDDFYFTVLFDENLDEIAPISDDKYAEELQLQEALMSSSIAASQIKNLDSTSAPSAPPMPQPYNPVPNPASSAESGESSLRFCEICVERKESDEMFAAAGCVHSYCTTCISQHVKTRVEDSVTVVTCPGVSCRAVLELDTCRPVLPKVVLDLWEHALCEKLIDESERFYCPFKDCSAVMINENSDSGEVIRESECPFCHRLFCAQCKVPWHPGVDCEEFQRLNEDERGRDDLMVREVAKEKKWGRCPHCKFYVERTDGCPHMTCRCGFLKYEKLEEELEELDQKLLKEKLRMWLLQKVAEDGEGPSVLDEGGQGVLHFAAALGYDWAFEPTIVAGVDVNFRDVHGWTALHWAASRGRERSVAFLLALGADPAAKTDPSPKYPLGRSSYQLASANGHKGVAGYLVLLEASITCLFESLSLDVQDEVNYLSEVQLFREKQLGRSGDDKSEISDEQALSLIAVKSYKTEQNHEPMHAAAIRIQNKFRSWKCRKLFLIIRKRIVKIQAHVRGHQVRKIYRTKVWSMGVVDIEVGGSGKGHQIHHQAGIDHSAAKRFSSSQRPHTRKKDDGPVKRTLRLPASMMGISVLPPRAGLFDPELKK